MERPWWRMGGRGWVTRHGQVQTIPWLMSATRGDVQICAIECGVRTGLRLKLSFSIDGGRLADSISSLRQCILDPPNALNFLSNYAIYFSSKCTN
jgi:hypothetical protein